MHQPLWSVQGRGHILPLPVVNLHDVGSQFGEEDGLPFLLKLQQPKPNSTYGIGTAAWRSWKVLEGEEESDFLSSEALAWQGAACSKQTLSAFPCLAGRKSKTPA